MMIAKDTQDLSSPLAVAPQQVHLQNKNFLQKSLQKVSSLVSMTNWVTSNGPFSFLKHRVIKTLTILSIRKSWVPSHWQKMDMYWAPNPPNTSRQSTFFIHHYHDSGNINLKYCPTEVMWAEVFTKPLQGPRFCLMRAFLIIFILITLRIWYVPSPLPTLAPITISPKSHRLVKHPSVHPTNLLMKPRVNTTSLLLRGYIEAKSQGTKVPYSERMHVLEKSKLTDK